MVRADELGIALLWILFAPTQAILLFRIHHTSLSYEDASRECRGSGGTLPVADGPYVDGVLARILESKAIQSTWLYGKQSVQPWSWVKGEVALRDQGCVEHEGMKVAAHYDMTPKGNFQTCLDFCKQHPYSYAGVTYLGDGHRCVCSDGVTSRQAPMVKCPAECQSKLCGGENNYFRLLATNGAEHVFPWLNSSLTLGGCGALSYNSGDTPHSIAIGLEREKCQDVKPFLCTFPSGSEKCSPGQGGSCVVASDLRLDWLSSRQACREDGGELASMAAFSSDLQHWSLSHPGAGSLWVGLTAEKWSWQNGVHTAFNFTNWVQAAEDSRTQGCLVMNIDGQWERADCNRQRSVVCQIHEDDGGTTVPVPSHVPPYTATTTLRSSRLAVPTKLVTSRAPSQTTTTPTRLTSDVPSFVAKSTQELPIAIIGGACGAVLVVVIVIIVVSVFLCRRRNHKRLVEEPVDNSSSNPVYDVANGSTQNRPAATTESNRDVEYVQNVDMNINSQSIGYRKSLPKPS